MSLVLKDIIHMVLKVNGNKLLKNDIYRDTLNYINNE